MFGQACIKTIKANRLNGKAADFFFFLSFSLSFGGVRIKDMDKALNLDKLARKMEANKYEINILEKRVDKNNFTLSLVN